MSRKKLPDRINDDYTIKVIILYLLRELGRPLSFSALSEIIIYDGKVNYFVFASCLVDLADRGMVDRNNDVYSINALGLELLGEVEDGLLDSVKTRMLRSAARVFAFNRSGSVITSDIVPKNDGYDLLCTIKDNKYDLVELKLYVDTKEEAEFLKSHFDDNAEIVYRGILALLSGEVKLLFDEKKS
ncbi:MAG: DUF4364 family protein [Clostridia bacterium]|nr:DUF4364 family protein [Clostridia bacterium]